MKLNDFLVCNEAKRDILLSILIPSMTNIIDNISTKPSIIYAEAKQCLVSLPSNQKYKGDAALVVKRAKYNNNKQKFPNSVSSNSAPKTTTASSTKMKSCSYCKKHGRPHIGHTWWDCQFLKEDYEKRKRSKQRLLTLPLQMQMLVYIPKSNLVGFLTPLQVLTCYQI